MSQSYSYSKASAYRLRDHYVICNWSEKVDMILREINDESMREERRPTVIITTEPINESLLPQSPKDQGRYEDVTFYPGDPSHWDVLHRLNYHDAKAVLILAQPELGSQADARTLLTLFSMLNPKQEVMKQHLKKRRDPLAVLKHRKDSGNPLHIVVEVVDVASYSKFKHFEEDEYAIVEIVRPESVRTRVLAQAAYTHGTARFYQDLMKYGSETNEIYSVEIPHTWYEAAGDKQNHVFSNLYLSLLDPAVRKRGVRAIPVGIWRPPSDAVPDDAEYGQGTYINPSDKIRLAPGEHPDAFKMRVQEAAAEPEDPNKEVLRRPGDHVLLISMNNKEALRIAAPETFVGLNLDFTRPGEGSNRPKQKEGAQP